MHTTLTFDCYGTLIDWESGIWDALQPLLTWNQEESVHRAMALAGFAAEESRLQAAEPERPYPLVLEAVHARIAARFGLRTTSELDRAFGASVGHWPAFPDSADALRRLKRQFQLVILSNVDRAGFAESQRKLGVSFDAVYTAEDIGSYKPSDRNFEYLLEHVRADLGVGPDQILHVAQSLFHDHVPAMRHGLATVWIDRQGLSMGGEWGATAPVEQLPEVAAIYSSMAELAAALDQ